MLISAVQQSDSVIHTHTHILFHILSILFYHRTLNIVPCAVQENLVRLEEAQRGLTRLGQEQQALNRALEEEGKQREVLRRSKAELEEQKRLLDRTVDRLNKEVGTGWPRLMKRLSSYRSLPGAVDRGGNGVTACGVCFPQVHCRGSQGQRGRVASFLCPLSVFAHSCHPIPLRSNPWRPSVSWSSF